MPECSLVLKSYSLFPYFYPPPLPLLCESSGALHLAQPGLMAGWLAGWQAGRRNTGEFLNFQSWL